MTAGIAIATLALASQTPGDEIPGWQTVSPAPGHYSVMMPGAPSEEISTKPSPFGPLEVPTMKSVVGHTAYFAMTFKQPDPVPKGVSKDKFEAIREDIIKKTGGKLVGETRGAFGGRPYLDLTILEPGPVGNGEIVRRVRIILAGPATTYGLVVTAPEGEDSPENTGTFFESFRLLAPERPPLKVVAPPKWATFSPPGGGLSVSMPGTPVERSKITKFSSGEKLVHIFVGTSLSTAYTLSYVDFISEARTMDGATRARLLNEICKHAVENAKGTVTRQVEASSGENPGRDVRYEIPARVATRPPQVGRMRVLMAGPRLFMLLVIGPEAQVDSKPTEAFFRSFTLKPEESRPDEPPEAGEGGEPAPPRSDPE